MAVCKEGDCSGSANCLQWSIFLSHADKCCIAACTGSVHTRVLLAHVRRWKSDKAFFQAARKLFIIEDISIAIDPQACARSSHARGALRLFQLTRKP